MGSLYNHLFQPTSGYSNRINAIWTALRFGFCAYKPLQPEGNFSVLFLLIAFIGMAASAQAQVSGRVFQDYNANGVYDTNRSITAADGSAFAVAVDIGIAGVTVTAYNSGGGVAGSTTTAADGTYTIPGLTGSIRVEFSTFPANYLSGPVGSNNGTTVQFVTAPSTNVNLGLNRSWDYSEDNPSLVTNCYVPLSNSGTYANNDVLVSVPNSAGSSVYSNGIVCSNCPTGFNLPTPNHLATHAQIGSTFGLGWQRSSKTLFAATYIKQFSDVGPQGTGAIYRIDMSDPANPVVKTGTPNTPNGPIDLNLIFGANTCGANPFSPYPDFGTESGRQQVGDAVFNAGFADIDVSEDGKTLYALSFNDKKLYSIPIDGSPINSTTIQVITVPVIDSPGFSLSNIRPTGMGLKDGKVYVAVQGAFIIDQSLTFDRGITVGNTWETARYIYNGYSVSGAPSGPITAVYVYDPATTSFMTTPVLSFQHWDNAGLKLFPLATIYTDLVFDEMGAMVLSGRYMKDDITGGSTGSRLLRACNDGTGTYVLEGPGGCGGLTTVGSSSTNGTSIGMYYYQTAPTDGLFADANGGLVHLPGHPYIIETQYDPYRVYSAGLRWLDNTTGQSLKSLEIVSPQAPIAFPGVEWNNKSGILGKLVPLLSSAPIEIGNRVWADTDNDGLQDANETGIAGVSVSLCTGAGVLIATATTDANGTYYFSNANGTSTNSAIYSLSALTANTTYQLKFPTSPGGRLLVTANTGADNIDSDASATGLVSFSTADFGANDHTFDVGYSLPLCSLTASVTPAACNTATNQYAISGAINLTATSGGMATITDGIQSVTVSIAASATSVAYTMNGLISDGTSHTVTVSLPGCGTTTAIYTAPASCTVAASILVTSATVCYGSSATLVASGCTGTVSWNTGTTGTSLVTPALTASTSYTATCTTGTGSTTTAVGTVTVLDQPVLSLSASSTLVTVGTPVSLSAIGCTGSVAWSTGATTSVVSVTPANATNVYSATCTTGPGCTKAASITIGTAPSASLIVVSATVCYGTSATLTTSGCTGTVSWNTGTTGTSLVTPALTASTSYTATCTTGTGSTTTAVGTVTVLDQPVLSLSASSTLVTVGTPVSLSAIGCTGSVAWSTGATTSVVSVTPANATNVYSATCTTGPGCTKAASITVNTTAACSVSLTTSSLPIGTVGQAYSATLTATGGTAPYSFSLASGSLPAGITLNTTTGVLSGTPTNPGSFSTSIRITDSQSCSAIRPLAVLQIELAPICSLTVTATPGSCSSATNTYTVSGSLSLTNNTAGGTILLSDGVQSSTVSVSSGVTTVAYSLTGLVSDGSVHTVVATLSGCGTSSVSYTAPGSCTQPVGTKLSLEKLVNKSKAKLGDVLTYTLVLTNIGTTTASNVVVTDSSTIGLTYVANSATAPAGTTFTQGAPISTWKVATLTAGQSVSLTFQAKADSSGILFNKAYIPGDTATVCTSIPVVMCAGDQYAFTLTAPAGRSSYKWFKDNVEIVGQTTNVLEVTAPGTYSLAVDNVTGKCPDFSCCPFIVEEDTLPTFQAAAVVAGCVGNVAQANGQLVVSNFKAGYTYQYSLGASFNEAASLSGAAKVIPGNGVLVSNLANPVAAQAYTIRVYNASGCYTDMTVMLLPTVCGCPAEVCVPYVITQTKRAKRIGDVR